MSPAPIALLTRLDAAAEESWLATLSKALASESVVPLRAIEPERRAAVEIAIVADPDPADLAGLTGLRWVHSLWAGVERLVAELGAGAPPIVRLVDPEMARTMAEAALAWTYYLQRDMPAYAAQQRQGVWRPLDYRPPSRVTVALLGLGALGQAAAARLGAAGFVVRGWSRSPKALAGVETFSGERGLDECLAGADIVICLMPLTTDTRGLMNAERFSAMKPGAALVNFARGPIVVVDDLLAALDQGRLSHAVLDVFEIEPLPASSPLWGHDRVTVLPHVSGPTDRDSAAAIVAANVRAYRETGAIPAVVDLVRGY
ncbi:2-hydroxyacid dehydrogenase [Methylopila henanensis]|uniref:2-hydroxyacid dehydrogenase n=1 Tax=Methylopila henanensis TaxID=873516 RepID=A0ABW4K6V6_9HYPH